jgi:outer membrane scaffolding protein for murein synthesis (MipA/OmpV family)
MHSNGTTFGNHAWRRGLTCLPLAAALVVPAGHVWALSDAGALETVPRPEARQWEGAIGLIGTLGPAYQGADQQVAKVTPGFFLRYGRFTITNSSGFVTRRADEVSRGLGIDLQQSDRVRISLGLRFDRGRDESTGNALAGMGDVKPTVRARLSGTWRLQDGWRAAASWSVDAFGRGGGNFGEVGFSREQRLSPETVWTWGGALALAGDRYMQTYFGVNAQQAAATGYPEYTPAAGLRDVSLFAGVRSDLGPRWTALGGIGVSRLLGPPVNSPLTRQVSNWGLSGGLAWRF